MLPCAAALTGDGIPRGPWILLRSLLPSPPPCSAPGPETGSWGLLSAARGSWTLLTLLPLSHRPSGRSSSTGVGTWGALAPSS
eukprot:5586802-Alexandrium_andersonii.AAC.1